MKSRICCIHSFTSTHYEERLSHSGSATLSARRQFRLLLGACLLLILCWMMASVWLISMRREGRSIAEVRERQAIVASFAEVRADRH